MIKDGIIIRIQAAASIRRPALKSHFTLKFANTAPKIVPKKVVQMPSIREFFSALLHKGRVNTSSKRLAPFSLLPSPRSPGFTA